MTAGVRVLVSVWDEIDSRDNILVYTVVEKKLHGGGAPAYFRDTGVVVKLMPRATHAKQVRLQQWTAPDVLTGPLQCDFYVGLGR